VILTHSARHAGAAPEEALLGAGAVAAQPRELFLELFDSPFQVVDDEIQRVRARAPFFTMARSRGSTACDSWIH